MHIFELFMVFFLTNMHFVDNFFGHPHPANN